MNKTNLIVGGIIIILLLAIGGWGGWSLHKEIRPCPTVTTDTVTMYDTVTYTIHDSVLVHKVDTIYIPGDTIVLPPDVDTATILKNYFTVLDYTWSKQDSNIRFDLKTRITQNRPVKYDFTYNILKPFTTVINNIDNSVSYNKYVQFGLSMPVYTYMPNSNVNIQDLGLEGTYVFPKGYAGIKWQPNNQLIEARAGVTIFKIRQIK